jgi:ectoine hydroxylase-related dioxygenase (phytanoyl-CoA dioxygenase family)
MLASLERDGFVVLEDLVSRSEIETLVLAIEAQNGGSFVGVRQPHRRIPAVANLIASRGIHDLVQAALGTGARLVRSVLFDKTTESNWAVPWHQDLTIAVAEKRDAPGFVGWSVKDAVQHVQAPREVLEQMLTLRLHLDDSGPENGPLRVLPGTHSDGWLDSETIYRLKAEIPEQVCVLRCCGALLMRPLLLHASSRAVKPGHRRVLHFEFAASELPQPLRFAA